MEPKSFLYPCLDNLHDTPAFHDKHWRHKTEKEQSTFCFMRFGKAQVKTLVGPKKTQGRNVTQNLAVIAKITR